MQYAPVIAESSLSSQRLSVEPYASFGDFVDLC